MYFRKHHPELDVIRVVAIILVMLFHFRGSFNLSEEYHLVKFLIWGNHGVDLFFALSGFLIGGQIIENNIRKSFNFKIFYIKRFWRIFPPYYAAILVFIFVSLVFSNGILSEWAVKESIVHLLYIQNYTNATLYGGLYWTLAVEEQFYIIIPFILFLLFRYGQRLTIPALIALVFFSVIIGFFLVDPAEAEWWYFVIEHNVRGFGTLLSGVIAAAIFINYNVSLMKSYFLRMLLFVVSILFLCISYFFGGNAEFSWYGAFWQFIPTAIGFSTMILFFSLFSLNKMPFQNFIRMIANLSYSMYLYHVLISLLMMKVVPVYFYVDRYSFIHFFILFIIYFFLVVLLSGLFYKIIDKPCMDYRAKILKKSEKL